MTKGGKIATYTPDLYMHHLLDEQIIYDHELDVPPLEAKVAQLVYNLYGLTEEEIAVVEESPENGVSTKSKDAL